jgi:hypothetical protein
MKRHRVGKSGTHIVAGKRAQAMLDELQSRRVLHVRRRSFSTGEPEGDPFLIRYVHHPKWGLNSYQVEQGGKVKDKGRLMSNDDAWRWMHNLVQVPS